jgi:hypothetical protein
MKNAFLSALEQLAITKKLNPYLIGVLLVLVYLVILGIQIDTAMTLYSAIKALFHNAVLAALSAFVFVVLDLGLMIAGAVGGRPLCKIGLATWLAVNAWILGTQIYGDDLVANYYVARVENYASAVFNDRLDERAAAVDLCKSSGQKPCDAMYDPELLVRLPPLRRADDEDTFDYLVRIYNQAFAAECRVPDHVAKFNELRKDDPRRPRRDPIALLRYDLLDLLSSASIASVIFAAIVCGLHVFGILIAEKLIAACKDENHG